jgi:DNA polymerase-3 subunit gamma/tau
VPPEDEPQDEPSGEPLDEQLAPAVDSQGWAVTAIPESEPSAPAPRKRAGADAAKTDPAAGVTDKPKATPTRATPAPATGANQRYGESVVRELLNANFLEEQDVAPRVVPVPKDD